MKELTGVAVNMAIVPGEGKKGGRPAAEVIIVVTEPQYRLVGDDGLARERVAESLRFVCLPSGLRALAEDFVNWADEAEAWAASLGCEKKGD